MTEVVFDISMSLRSYPTKLDLMVMNRDGSGQRLIRRFGRIVDGREPGAEGRRSSHRTVGRLP